MKEQEVIKRLNFHKEYARLSSNRVVISETDLETVLNMLKENSAEIEQKNTELAEKNAEIEKLKKVLDEKYIFVQCVGRKLAEDGRKLDEKEDKQ